MKHRQKHRCHLEHVAAVVARLKMLGADVVRVFVQRVVVISFRIGARIESLRVPSHPHHAGRCARELCAKVDALFGRHARGPAC